MLYFFIVDIMITCIWFFLFIINNFKFIVEGKIYFKFVEIMWFWLKYVFNGGKITFLKLLSKLIAVPETSLGGMQGSLGLHGRQMALFPNNSLATTSCTKKLSFREEISITGSCALGIIHLVLKLRVYHLVS